MTLFALKQKKYYFHSLGLAISTITEVSHSEKDKFGCTKYSCQADHETCPSTRLSAFITISWLYVCYMYFSGMAMRWHKVQRSYWNITINSLGFSTESIVKCEMQSYGFSDAEMSSALNGFSQVFYNINLLIYFPLLPLQQLKHWD